MRRTVVIDDKLLQEAREVLGTNGIRETLETSLREVIRDRRLQEFAVALGTFQFSMSDEDLAKMREDRHDPRLESAGGAVPDRQLGVAADSAAEGIPVAAP